MPTLKKTKKKTPARPSRPAPVQAPPLGRRLSQELVALVLLVVDVFLILRLAS